MKEIFEKDYDALRVQKQINAHGVQIAANAARILEKTSYGVVSGLVVSAQSTPDMTVKVSAGVAYTSIDTRYAPTAVASIAVTTADATNPRIDLVYLSSAGVVSYLAGTAAATPAAPATPTGGLPLARISVAANATTITSTNILTHRKNPWVDDWITPTLLNSATHGTVPVQFCRSLDGTVRWRGRIVVVTAGASSIAIPAGYRTNQYLSFVLPLTTDAVTFKRCDVLTEIVFYATGTYDLAAISYRAEA